MYVNTTGAAIPLGDQLGKGGAATVYLHGQDRGKAVKIFRPEYLAKEQTLARRLQQLHKLSNVAALDVEFGGRPRAVGSWPKDLVMERSGRVVGFTMDTVHDGIDLTEVIYARDPRQAFFKYSPQGKRFKSKAHHQQWMSTFLYHPEGLRNRFILCYYLAVSFERIYDLRGHDGKRLELQLCNFDIKPNNILVSLDKQGGTTHIIPYILDLDNLTMANSTGRMAPSHPQHTPEYRAPEGPVDKYYDYYSIAVIFHQLIFNIHPFEGVQGASRFTDGTVRDFFAQNKCYPWGRNGRFLKRTAVQHENFPRLPKDLQALFLRAFDSDTPSQRPDMRAWSEALVRFLSDRSIRFEQLFQFP
jgi:DNA-binding helix-hairpin-helix protein with protein kinase domain